MPRKHVSDEIKRLKLMRLAAGHNPSLCAVVERNITALIEVRRQAERRRGLQSRIADAITEFSGSMLFIYLHAVWFGLWVLANLGGLGPRLVFDPYPFGLLTMIVSLEAIFLSTFVLLSQNRQAEMADRRADLDLQINLLTEYEVTRILTLVDAIADHFGLEPGADPEIEDLKKDIVPEQVLREIDVRASQTEHKDEPVAAQAGKKGKTDEKNGRKPGKTTR
jgi:uncharacterized membrane protein